jgi:tRNA pseudouridine13 synthase
MPSMTAALAYLTPDVPGTGGVIKQRFEDFIVEEQPLYEPCGQGEHLYVYVEKRGRTTMQAVRRLAKMFKVRRGAVGYAGLKDKYAVTRQLFSIHRPDPTEDQKLLERFAFTPLTLIWSARHTNKLKRGHLRGNRFVIHIRDVGPAAVVRAKAVLDHLARDGVPNFIGEQRFGYRQNNHEQGRLLILGRYKEMLDTMLGDPRPTDGPPTQVGRAAYDRGDYAAALEVWPRQLHHDRQALDALRQGKSPRDAVRSVERGQIEFLLSSVQSAVFNHVLDRRLRDGLLGRLVPGDLAWKHENRSVFSVDDATAELENGPTGRIATFAVSPSGPMWGRNMIQPQGQPLAWERQGLEAIGLTETDVLQSEHSPEGRRRPMRVPILDPDISAGADEFGPYIRLAFELPRGSFATIVTREIIKPTEDTTAAQDDDHDQLEDLNA